MTDRMPGNTIKLLGWDDLRDKGIKDSKPTIYRKIKSGKFPQADLSRQIPRLARARNRLAPSIVDRSA